MEATATIGPAPMQVQESEPEADRMYTIKELRKARGWSQVRLAIHLGCSPISVSTWELLKTRPDQFYTQRLEETFGVPANHIVLKPIHQRRTAPDYGWAMLDDR